MKRPAPRRTSPLVTSLVACCLTFLQGAATVSCSGPGGAGGAGGAGGGAGTSDPVLSGAWQFVFSGTEFDYPNTRPWVDADGEQAHFLYVDKAGGLRYFLFGDATQQEVTLPQGTKNFGRLGVLSSGGAIVITTEPFNGQLGALRFDGAAVTPLEPPFGAQSVSLLDLAAASVGDAMYVAARGPAEEVLIARMSVSAAGAPSPWTLDGQLPGTGEIVTRVVLAAGAGTVALAVLSGMSTRHVFVRANDAWKDLGSPPDAGPSGFPSLVLDGQDVYYLEWQGEPQRSVLFRHDGSAWTEHARSGEGECLRALAKHQGGLYALTATSPNGSTLRTEGVARLDEGEVTRVPFDAYTADANIDTESRVDVADYQESYLVSRAGRLYLAYQEMGGVPIIHLYRHAAP